MIQTIYFCKQNNSQIFHYVVEVDASPVHIFYFIFYGQLLNALNGHTFLYQKKKYYIGGPNYISHGCVVNSTMKYMEMYTLFSHIISMYQDQ